MLGTFLNRLHLRPICVMKFNFLYTCIQKEKKNNDTNDLSLFLFANQDVKGTVKFKLLNNEGQAVVNRVTEFVCNSKEGWGFPSFVSRDFITNPANNILRDDKMTITCQIRMSYIDEIEKQKKVAKPKSERQAGFLPKLDKYEVLLNDGRFSDVSLISSEGKTLKVHKSILANGSSVFAAMFEADMKEKQKNTVEIVDIKYDVLVEMVRFIYAEKINNIDGLAGELAVAADKYVLDDLKDMCEKSMIRNLSVGNVIHCLQLADKLCMNDLVEEAVEFIVEEGSNVTRKPEFESLPFDVMCKICRSLTEYSI